MTAVLNHTIVPASDKHASAAFLVGILGLEEPRTWGPFVAVTVGNGVTLDFDDQTGFESHHYAFLVNDGEFDPIFGEPQLRGEKSAESIVAAGAGMEGVEEKLRPPVQPGSH